MRKSTKEMAQLLKVSLGTFRNQYANNLQKINERLEQLGVSYKVVEKKKIGRNVVFILESSGSPSGAPNGSGPISLHHPSTSQEAGSPPPASSFTPPLTERDREELDQLSAEKRQEAFRKLKVVKYAFSYGVRKAAKEFGKTPSSVHRWCRIYTVEGVKALVGIKKRGILGSPERSIQNGGNPLLPPSETHD